mgnify:CR=1 FL=1
MYLRPIWFLLVLGVMFGSECFAKGAPVNQWLLGYEAQVESAVSLASVGSNEPHRVTDYALELAITDLALISAHLEDRLDSCSIGKQSPSYCSAVAGNGNKKARDSFRRKILARRALITFFRNFLIQEFNKQSAQRNFANALRMGQKIKNI